MKKQQGNPQNAWVLQDTHFSDLLGYVYKKYYGEIWLFNNDLYVLRHDNLFQEVYKNVIDHPVLRPRIQSLKFVLEEELYNEFTDPKSATYQNLCRLSPERIRSIYIANLKDCGLNEIEDENNNLGNDPWIFYTVKGSLVSARSGADDGLVFLRSKQYPFSLKTQPHQPVLAVCWHVEDHSPETRLIRTRIQNRFDAWFTTLSHFKSLEPTLDDSGNVHGLDLLKPRTKKEISRLWENADLTPTHHPRLESKIITADIGIITALEEEAKSIADKLDHCEIFPGADQTYRIGYYPTRTGQVKTIVLCTPPNMGNVNSSLATYSLIKEFKPDVVFLVGIAGGKESEKQSGDKEPDINGTENSEIPPKVNVGDVVVARFIAPYEYEKIEAKQKGGKMVRASKHESRDKPCTGTLVQVAEILKTEWNSARDPNRIPNRPEGSDAKRNWAGVHVDTVASGSKVIADEFIQEEINNKQVWSRKIVALEMEGEGFAEAAMKTHTDFILVKGISDMANIKKRDDAWRRYASNAASQFVFDMIDRLEG